MTAPRPQFRKGMPKQAQASGHSKIAQFDGVCWNCHESITAGRDKIARDAVEDRWVHEDCVGQGSMGNPYFDSDSYPGWS